MMHTWVVMVFLAVPWIAVAGFQDEAAASVGGIGVDHAVVCTGVIDRHPEGPGEVFDADVGRLFCFTRITGIQAETTVTHVWYAGEERLFECPLTVRPPTWRTWSMKNIQPARKGPWRVDIVGPDGGVLQTIEFSIR